MNPELKPCAKITPPDGTEKYRNSHYSLYIEKKTREDRLVSRYVDYLCFINSPDETLDSWTILCDPRVETLRYNNAVPMGLRRIKIQTTPYI